MANDINKNPLIDQLGIQQKQAEQAKKKDNLGQEDFLKLLIAQIENQDPMKPQDNGEFLGQMAQFSTVSGLSEMQKSIDNLSQSFMSNQALQASSLVGRLVLVPAEKGYLPEGEGDRFFGAIESDDSLQSLTVEIKSDTGALVKTISMGAKGEGMHRFAWDGTDNFGDAVPAGNYSIVATGVGSDGEQRAVTSHILAPVESVTLGSGGEKMRLNVAGFGSMPIDSVREIM